MISPGSYQPVKTMRAKTGIVHRFLAITRLGHDLCQSGPNSRREIVRKFDSVGVVGPRPETEDGTGPGCECHRPKFQITLRVGWISPSQVFLPIQHTIA